MYETEYKILSLFKENPGKELSTEHIISRLYPDSYKKLNEELKKTDKKALLKAKRKKAQLHRKALYYLNKLVKEDIIRLSKEGAKGRKYFALSLSADEEFIIKKYKRKIIISQPMPAMPIEGYEQKGILHKFSPATWIDRLNSILLECSKINDLKKLYKVINECFANVNDVIALNDFELLLQEATSDEAMDFLRKIDSDCSDYGKYISCIIDLTNIKTDKTDRIIDALEFYEKLKSTNINFIFDTRSKELRENSSFFEKVIEIFSRSKIQLHIKNQDLHEAPYMLGRAGPYAFDESEWKLYKKKLQGKILGIACGQSTIAVDIDKFFTGSRSIKQFREFIMKIVNALLAANSLQRKRSEEYFKNLISLNIPLTRELFIFSKDYIRFWNYGWKQPKLDENLGINLIKSVKEEVDDFAVSEDTIYKACGIPTRFRVAFSCAFKEFDTKAFSEEKFKRIQIKKIEDLYSNKIKQLLKEKEEIFTLFDGGDRLRFYRSGDINAEDICRELNIILNTFKIPFFCYDFGEITENIKLTSFI